MRPRPTPIAFRRVCLLALVALAAIVVTGGAVRLSSSGLGCSTWPQCEPGSYTSSWQFHPAIEFGNRLVTIAVGLATLFAAAGSLLLRPRRRDLIWLSWALVAGYLAQAVIGGLSVLYALSPLWVMAHFLVSMLLLWDAVVLYRRAEDAARGVLEGAPPIPVARSEVLWLGRLLAGAAAVVLVLGTLVAGTGPHSGDEHTVRLTLLSLDVVTRLHADVVLFLIGFTVALLAALRLGGAPARVRRMGRWLLYVMVAQAAVGFAQYFLHLPAGLVGVHIAGATVFWVFTLFLVLGLHEREPAAVPTQPPPPTQPAPPAPPSRPAGARAAEDEDSVGAPA